MAKESMKAREVKRQKCVDKYAEKRALLEKEKSNIRFKAEDAAEQAVMQRFENLVENLRKGWQDEEREHLEQQEHDPHRDEGAAAAVGGPREVPAGQH